MTITRIDSATILIDGVTFSKSDSGQYFTDSAEATEIHKQLIDNYVREAKEDAMGFYQESLCGIIICIN